METLLKHPPTPRALLTELDRATTRGRDALIARQHANGSWHDHIDVGPVAVATQLVLERCLGRLTEKDAEAGRRALRAARNADGGWPGYPGDARGSVTATALALEALADDEDTAPSRAWLEAQGGQAAVVRAFVERGDVAALFLVAAGSLAPTFLPKVPLSVLLTPYVDRLVDGRVHAGNLMALVVVSAVGDSARHDDASLLGSLLGGVVRSVQRERAIQLLAEWQNPDGSWNQALFPTQLMTLGLHALGLTDRDERMSRALDWLERQKRIEDGALLVQAIPNDVWSTAQAVLALQDAGGEDEDAIARAVDFLMDQQHRDLQPRANQRRKGAVRTGGWAFQADNPTMPDCDDSGLVLAALGEASQHRCTRPLVRSIDRGLAWLRDMQNPDGGWPAYVWDLPAKRPGPMFGRDFTMPRFDDPRHALAAFIAPPPELGDPATEGVTARVLLGLGACGITRDEPMVCAAIDFLKAQQCTSGAFWDRWMTCYLPGTATVLSGLAAVGEDMRAAYVQRAVAWMIARQNDDGGFGETADAFCDASRAGQGPSMAPVTGFVLGALVDARAADSDAARRAVRYLLSTQRADGGWDDGGWVNPYVPPETFYRYALPSLCTPLGALGKYRRWLAR